jgi:hypothetical protein
MLSNVTAQKAHSCDLTAQLPLDITCLLNVFRVEGKPILIKLFPYLCIQLESIISGRLARFHVDDR